MNINYLQESIFTKNAILSILAPCNGLNQYTDKASAFQTCHFPKAKFAPNQFQSHRTKLLFCLLLHVRKHLIPSSIDINSPSSAFFYLFQEFFSCKPIRCRNTLAALCYFCFHALQLFIHPCEYTIN